MSETLGILLTGGAPQHLVPRYGDYPDMFVTWMGLWRPALRVRVYRAFEGELPSSTMDADIWLITGSRHSVLDNAPWMLQLEKFLRAIVQEQKRLCGVCFGHQVVAKALGGTVERWSGGWQIGRQHYCWRSDDASKIAEIAMNAFHEDQVVSAPATARTVASSSTCPHAVLLYGDTVITTQAHPEFRDDYLKELIRVRLTGKLNERDIVTAISSLEQPIDIEPATRLLLSRIFPAK